MKLGLTEEMRRIDREAAEKYGLSELLLMENAGCASARLVRETLGKLAGKTVVIVAGSGNNGGDALSAARHLLNMGARVKVFLSSPKERLKPSPLVMYNILEKMGLEVSVLGEERGLDRLRVALRLADGVLDGLLGTGFSGALREKAKKIVEEINRSGLPVISIDIPSGVDSETGAAAYAVRARATLSLGLLKPGHIFYPGRELAGRVTCDSIGLPQGLLADARLKHTLLDRELAASILPRRAGNAYKGSCGRVLVVAGSRGMVGAAALSSLAALRAGAGLVTLAVPASEQRVLAAKLTEVMVQPIPECEEGHMGGEAAVERVLELAKGADALLMGPGLGRAPETLELVRLVSEMAEAQLVLDADALYAFKGEPEALTKCHRPPIITPHLGELSRLLEISAEEIEETFLPMAEETAREYRAMLVAKSDRTVVAAPAGEVYISALGNPGMATAGAGDVLAGTIAGLCREAGAGAAALGVYLHSRAGDLAYEKYGEGLIAGDIAAYLPEARKELRA